TSSYDCSTSATWVWQRTSFSRVSATKPSISRLLSLVECSSRQPHEQWKFVRMSPLGETNEAVQLESRTVASRTRSSHWGVRLTPYFCWMSLVGGLSNVHMPSSACAVQASVRNAERSNSLS